MKKKDSTIIKKENTIKNNIDEKVLINFLDSKKYYAIIYNTNGEQIGLYKLKRDMKNFTFNDKTYIVDFNHDTSFTRSSFWKKHKYFYYNVNNTSPISFSDITNPKFDTELLNIMLNTKVAKDLNNLSNPLSALLTPKNILIGLAVIGALIYFGNGGTIN